MQPEQTQQHPGLLCCASSIQKDEGTTPRPQPAMALWGDCKLFFCILSITCFFCCTVTLAQRPTDCCLSVTNKTIDKVLVADYHRQISGHGCSIDAMIFLTRRGKSLCVTADEPWIQQVVKHVDGLKERCKKKKCKGKRCSGVRCNQ